MDKDKDLASEFMTRPLARRALHPDCTVFAAAAAANPQ
jgi:hypothetical protein